MLSHSGLDTLLPFLPGERGRCTPDSCWAWRAPRLPPSPGTGWSLTYWEQRAGCALTPAQLAEQPRVLSLTLPRSLLPFETLMDTKGILSRTVSPVHAHTWMCPHSYAHIHTQHFCNLQGGGSGRRNQIPED